VYVTFVVGANGFVGDVTIARGVNKYLNAEAIRVLNHHQDGLLVYNVENQLTFNIQSQLILC